MKPVTSPQATMALAPSSSKTQPEAIEHKSLKRVRGSSAPENQPIKRARLSSTPPEQRRESSDVFLNMLQGPATQVTIGSSTGPFAPCTYTLPSALLVFHSTYFQTQIPLSTNQHITLPTFIPAIFGLFLRFIYQGNYPPKKDLDASPAHHPIPPSAQAWILGHFLGAKYFQNYAITHLHYELGRTLFITPALIEWVMQNTNHPGAQLRRLFIDTLVIYWGRGEKVVDKRPGLDQEWEGVFERWGELRRGFIMGLKDVEGKTLGVGSVQRYFVHRDVTEVPPPGKVHEAAMAMATEVAVAKNKKTEAPEVNNGPASKVQDTLAAVKEEVDVKSETVVKVEDEEKDEEMVGVESCIKE
ncbi:hypothetical protein K504DRAFT_499768 [Pleomassaria siparia CBS 279.74]|uniref:BTB domain-containing protein n=1 Tax=Pleomassaria siparia CBS 279.74 TaxID=1314801 RepID=A0A6G1KIM2_9PLEO|nr:hypothetical protein K504DRAFT_499768 [Pleomassaria siparia CBS 279.74]